MNTLLLPLALALPTDVAVERHLAAMGTSLTLEVSAPDRSRALSASERAVRAIEATERRLSTWREDSELAHLNAASPGEAVEIGPALALELAAARRLHVSTEGAFDPGVGALVDAWDLRGKGRIPAAGELAAALEAGGLETLDWTALPSSGARVTRRSASMRLEEGAFGKGAGLDRALEELRAAGVVDAFVDLGGQVAVLTSPGGSARRAPLAHPDRRDLAVVEVRLTTGSLATSGNSERGVLIDGRSVGHLLDPRTGRPAPDFGSLTVWAPSALDADALSTGLYVMGPDAALTFAAAREDLEVLVLERTAAGLRARRTPGLDARAVTPELLVEVFRLDRSDRPEPHPPRTPMTLHHDSRRSRVACALALACALTPIVPAQDPEPDPQEDSYELRLRHLEDVVDALADDLDLGAAQDPSALAPAHGLDARAARVYSLPEGVSIGGYGEVVYRNYGGEGETDEFDLLRAVLYVGYKFDDRWVFNSEIEVEHGNEIYAEFAYIDYLHQEELNARMGLVLIPMGFVNRLHEPTSYLGASRPLNERYVIPSTWRENGAGAYGTLGEIDYEIYVVNGFDGTGFGGESGLRGGRQKGSKAKAEDLAVVASADWKGAPGIVVGASVYSGNAGHDDGMGDLETTIVEAHAEVRRGRIWARGLVTDAGVDDRDAGDLDLGGWYGELGFDLLADSERSALFPFVRFESIDTDEDEGGIDDTVLTYGLHWQPHPQIVFKLDHSDYDDLDDDVTSLLMGYVF